MTWVHPRLRSSLPTSLVAATRQSLLICGLPMRLYGATVGSAAGISAFGKTSATVIAAGSVLRSLMSRLATVGDGVGLAPTTVVSSLTSMYEPRPHVAMTTTVAITLSAITHGLCCGRCLSRSGTCPNRCARDGSGRGPGGAGTGGRVGGGAGGRAGGGVGARRGAGVGLRGRGRVPGPGGPTGGATGARDTGGAT